MLIDTACGEGNLRYLVEKLNDLPVIVVNTHTHFDHSGGNNRWEEVWAGEGADDELRKSASETAQRNPELFSDYKISHLSDGRVFDLGGRTVEAIAIGAHHRTSFAFLDRKNRSLYTGDEIENGQVLLWVSGEYVPETELVKRHLKNMEKLKAKENDFDRLYPAHNGAPISKDYIDDFIALSKEILAGEATPEKTVLGYGLVASLYAVGNPYSAAGNVCSAAERVCGVRDIGFVRAPLVGYAVQRHAVFYEDVPVALVHAVLAVPEKITPTFLVGNVVKICKVIGENFLSELARIGKRCMRKMSIIRCKTSRRRSHLCAPACFL